ncbi:MAG TPA: rhomboid family intramembrane serine protease [Roseiflexaceae bacterium]|nr:rhomboid family intramembrane serine protease [Roseiflexaceae bacterium]
MIPIGDENITRRAPVVNTLLLLANIGVFGYMLTLGDAGVERFILAWGVRAADVFALVGGDLSLLRPVLTAASASMFLHGGWAHIIGNMLFLWIFGDNVEDNFGSLAYLLFYLLSGYAAVGAQTLLAPQSQVPMIGASGAISGVLAGYLLLYPSAAVRAVLPIPILFLFSFYVPAWLMIIMWFVGQLLNGLATLTDAALMTGGVAYGAHVGGFLAGLALTGLFRTPTRPPRYMDYGRNARYYRR